MEKKLSKITSSDLEIDFVLPGVSAPPTFEYMTIVINTGTGLRPITSASLIVIGVISRTVVTLSKNADKRAVKRARQFMRGHTCPFVI